jgi:single-strand DNA-binding protein
MAFDHKNEVILQGNLGADPELRMTQAGKAVLKLRVATTRKYEANGQTKESTEWHRVVVFGGQAETLGKELSKGDTVFVFGELRTSSYEDKDKQKRYTTEVIASTVARIGAPRKSAPAEGGGSGGGYKKRGQAADDAGGGDYSGHDDGIPF